jgi:hypothetical protein
VVLVAQSALPINGVAMEHAQPSIRLRTVEHATTGAPAAKVVARQPPALPALISKRTPKIVGLAAITVQVHKDVAAAFAAI